ncbi:MAG: HAD family hydrolase [Faecousia sp.]
MRKTGIIFDLDGTLLDTLEDLADSVNHVLGEFGYPLRTLEEVRRFVGNGAARLINQAIPEGADAAPVLAAFQAYYSTHCQIKTKPYAGIPEALAQLQQCYPIAIVSNKPDIAVKALCTDMFPGVYARGESAVCPRKPAPDMVYKAMEAIGAETCIYVGDSEVDVLTAKNAGVPCLSVLWGFRDRACMEAAGASHYCDTPARLEAKIEEIIHGK